MGGLTNAQRVCLVMASIGGLPHSRHKRVRLLLPGRLPGRGLPVLKGCRISAYCAQDRIEETRLVVTGAPLPSSILRGVAMKDYWFADPKYSAPNNGICYGSLYVGMHEAFTGSVARVKRLGADHIHVTTWIVVQDATASTPFLDPTTIIIPDAELSFITTTAKAAGLDVWLDINIPSGDTKKQNLPTTPTQQWMASFLDQYTQFIVQTAQIAEKNGVKAMMLNWRDYFPSLTDYEDVYVAKMTSALVKIRGVYSGKVLLYDTLHDKAKASDLYSGVDAFMVDMPGKILSAEQNQNLDVAAVKRASKETLTWLQNYYGPQLVSKPLVINPFVQSHRNFLVSGWVEDCCCLNDGMGGCVQNALQTDFSVQAIGYEAIFEAVMESGLNILSIDPVGYWYVDVILPKDSYPNTSQSIRNKPAEAIVQRWFAK